MPWYNSEWRWRESIQRQRRSSCITHKTSIYHTHAIIIIIIMSHQASSHTGGGYKKGGVAPAPGAHKKESNAEMAKLLDTAVRVKCLGGRELRGTLRGYDDLINLVLDDCDEFIRGMRQT